MNNSPAVESTNQIINYLKDRGIAHMNVDGNNIFNNVLEVDGKELINFGSCSYLGLEYDERMKAGAFAAMNAYGTQFSASRAYISAGMYEELEEKLSIIFGGHVLVTPTTTLGHISTIPILIGKKDCVIMDHQVHHSVQTAVKLVKADGTHVEMIRHNRIDLLEQRLVDLKDQFENIWYMADGIYSMYGDKAPMKELEILLNKYDHFHLYVDDAHAMSCFGENGRGYALSEIDLHQRMVMGTSLNKAFASGGGAFVFPTKEMFDKVRNCGGPMITSGPMQPSALGAAIAAADIHLSEDIYDYQHELFQKIRYTHQLLKESGLPNLSERDSPIFFIGLGTPKVGYNLVSRMKEAGFLVNIGIFPAVPMKNTGLRFTITRLHTFEQIEQMVHELSHHFHLALLEENSSIQDVCKAFKLDAADYTENTESLSLESNRLQVQLVDSIIDVSKEEWNANLGRRGLFDWNGMTVFEHAMSKATKDELRTQFNYLTIRDKKGAVVIQTVISKGWIKDDMLADSEISKNLEEQRKSDKLLACSKYVSIGTPLSEGDHLYIDEDHIERDHALKLLYASIDQIAKDFGATTRIIRDLSPDNKLMDDFMVDNGYFRCEMPENFVLDISDWVKGECYTTILRSRNKRRFRNNVAANFDLYNVKIKQSVSDKELKHYFELYKNVQGRSLEINSFPHPYELFEAMNINDSWEFIEISLKPEHGFDSPVAVVFAYKGIGFYAPTMMGKDYSVDFEYNLYRQTMYQSIKAAKDNGYDEVRLGFTAGIEKKNFGAKGHLSIAYMQSADHFNMEAMLTSGDGKNVQLVSIER